MGMLPTRPFPVSASLRRLTSFCSERLEIDFSWFCDKSNETSLGNDRTGSFRIQFPAKLRTYKRGNTELPNLSTSTIWLLRMRRVLRDYNCSKGSIPFKVLLERSRRVSTGTCQSAILPKWSNLLSSSRRVFKAGSVTAGRFPLILFFESTSLCNEGRFHLQILSTLLRRFSWSYSSYNNSNLNFGRLPLILLESARTLRSSGMLLLARQSMLVIELNANS